MAKYEIESGSGTKKTYVQRNSVNSEHRVMKIGKQETDS